MQDRQQKLDRIRELTDLLNLASRTYYQEGREIMPNIDYDRYYDELIALEEETGFRLEDSPTQNVGYEIISELPKERHESPMLSLNKTKSVEELQDWLGREHQGVLSWKMDGITIVLTYENGVLTKAVTRGNGEVGEIVTANAKNFENLPLTIPYKGKLIVRGEAIITYSDFEKINEVITDAAARYKNPRNLCSGSVRQLDPSVTKGRHVQVSIFTLVSTESLGNGQQEPDFHNSFMARFDWLREQGFDVVESVMTDYEGLPQAIEDFKAKIPTNDFPSDGLVLAFEDVAYGISLGRTAKYPKNALAFKWQDETAETVLQSIDWSVSRTGLINPVAVFDPVELEGTTVSRASVHNLSIVKELKLGIGDHLLVYKANMIIPQVSSNLTESDNLEIPAHCPVCGGATEIRSDSDASYLYCTDDACPAKHLKSFALMVSRDALGIDGLSEKTLEKLLGKGFLKTFADLFRLERYRAEIAEMEGFGEKSAANLIAAAKKASETELFRVIYGLGISEVGLAGAKLICRAFHNDIDAIRHADAERFAEVDKIGNVIAGNLTAFFADEQNSQILDELLSVLTLKEAEENSSAEAVFEGKTFVITGDVEQFANRRAVQDVIELLGGKASGSVSAKTSYLINNDILSSSSKNKKAKELGIPIITEAEFIEMLPDAQRP